MKRYRNVVGKQLRERRNALGLSQSKLASALQLSGLFYVDTTMIGKIESGIRSVYDYEVQFIAAALDTSVDSLLPPIQYTKGEIEELYGRDRDV